MVCSPYAGTNYDRPVYKIWNVYVHPLQRYKRRRKMQKLGVVWGLEVTKSSETSPFDRVHMTSYSTLIETMRLSCGVFELVRFLSKVVNFNPPHLHLSPPWGLIPFEFRRDFWRQKARVPGLSCSIICVILVLAVLIQCRSVTDRQTDTQTDTRRRHIPRLA